MGRLPRRADRLGPVHLAPLLWVWWMRPTAVLPIWAYLAGAAGDVAPVLARGAAAQRRAADHAGRLAALARPMLDGAAADAREAPEGRPSDAAEARMLVDSAAYLADALAVAQATRALLLPLMAAAGRGAPRPDLRGPLAEARQALDRHQARWGGRADFPALELAEIGRFVDRAARSPRRTWLEARAACALVSRLRAGLGPGGRIGLAGAAGAASLGAALLIQRHRRVGLAGVALGLLLAGPLRRPLLHAALPWLSRRLNLLPSIFFETGPAMGEWVGGS